VRQALANGSEKANDVIGSTNDDDGAAKGPRQYMNMPFEFFFSDIIFFRERFFCGMKAAADCAASHCALVHKLEKRIILEFMKFKFFYNLTSILVINIVLSENSHQVC
jgi:hypothetical protein